MSADVLRPPWDSYRASGNSGELHEGGSVGLERDTSGPPLGLRTRCGKTRLPRPSKRSGPTKTKRLAQSLFNVRWQSS
jgi:hypothetical protein